MTETQINLRQQAVQILYKNLAYGARPLTLEILFNEKSVSS